MTDADISVRKKRVKEMNTVLLSLFPTTAIHLTYRTDWELLIAVILSAQCTDKRVNMITKDLFQKYTSIHDYKNAQRSELEKDVYQSGFFRAKARAIQESASIICERFNGMVPRTMEELRQLPGVGRKTANVILSAYHHKNDGIAVDTHVRRFALRFDLTDFFDSARIERDLMVLVPKKDWWSFPHRLIEYGRALCPAIPHDCSEHPLTKVFPPANERWPRAHGRTIRIIKRK